MKELSEEKLDSTEINRRINYVYDNLVKEFDPAVKKLAEAGSVLFKALLGVASAHKRYAEALGRVAAAADGSYHESHIIGDCLHEVSDVLKDIQRQHDDVISWFGSQMVTPTEANVKRDSSTLHDLANSYHSGQKAIGKRLKKSKKNGIEVGALTVQLKQLQEEGLQQALKEEVKRFQFVLERHVVWMGQYVQFQNQAVNSLQSKIGKWKEKCPVEGTDDEPTEVLAILDSAIENIPNGRQHEPNGMVVAGAGSESHSSSISLTDSTPSNQDSEKHPQQQNGNQENGDSTPEAVRYRRQDQEREIPQEEQDTSSYKISSLQQRTDSNAKRIQAAIETEQRTAEISQNVQNIVITTADVELNHERPSNSPKGNNSPVISENSSYKSFDNEESTAVAIQKPVRRIVELYSVDAIHDYKPISQNEMLLLKNDILSVLQEGKQGWLFGQNFATKRRGWFPASYTRRRSAMMPNGGFPNRASKVVRMEQHLVSVPEVEMVTTDVQTTTGAPTKDLHIVNYDTIPRNNPFKNVKLRKVQKYHDGTPEQYG